MDASTQKSTFSGAFIKIESANMKKKQTNMITTNSGYYTALIFSIYNFRISRTGKCIGNMSNKVIS